MQARLVPNPSLLEIEVEPHASLRADDLLLERLLELFDFGEEPLIFGSHEGEVLGFEELELGLESCEVDGLGVGLLEDDQESKAFAVRNDCYNSLDRTKRGRTFSCSERETMPALMLVTLSSMT